MRYCVYCLTFLNNKRYFAFANEFGMHEVFERRGGKFYKNKEMYDTITNDGWDNIRKEVVAIVMSQEEAYLVRDALIYYYKTYEEKYGYNRTFYKSRLSKLNVSLQEFLKQYGLDNLLAIPWKDSTGRVIRFRERASEIERYKELISYQMNHYLESLTNPLPEYKDPVYQEMFNEAVKEARTDDKNDYWEMWNREKSKIARMTLKDYLSFTP